MAIAQVQYVGFASVVTGSSLTSTISSTGAGNFLHTAVYWGTEAVSVLSVVTKTGGGTLLDTLSPAGNIITDANGVKNQLFYVANCKSGATQIVVTLSGSITSIMACDCWELSGAFYIADHKETHNNDTSYTNSSAVALTAPAGSWYYSVCSNDATASTGWVDLNNGWGSIGRKDGPSAGTYIPQYNSVGAGDWTIAASAISITAPGDTVTTTLKFFGKM